MALNDCVHFMGYRSIVPGERIELSWITPYDFESYASTNSAIPACYSILQEIQLKSMIKITKKLIRISQIEILIKGVGIVGLYQMQYPI